jgi:hypothetical protein
MIAGIMRHSHLERPRYFIPTAASRASMLVMISLVKMATARERRRATELGVVVVILFRGSFVLGNVMRATVPSCLRS